MHACTLSHFSHVRLCATLWTIAHQAPLPGISQARILEWIAASSSRESSQPRNTAFFKLLSLFGRTQLWVFTRKISLEEPSKIIVDTIEVVEQGVTYTSCQNHPHWRRSSRKPTRCHRHFEMRAFFSCTLVLKASSFQTFLLLNILPDN